MAQQGPPAVLAALLMGACVTWLLISRPPPGNVLLEEAGPPYDPKPRELDWWQAMHQRLVGEIEAADAEGSEGYGILFYGDSITESWRGTDCGHDCPRCAGALEVLQKHFGKYRPGIMAIGGDRSENLWWRLLNGETPAKHHPKAVVLLIGTNDLGRVWQDTDWDLRAEPLIMQAVPEVTVRMLSILRHLRDALPDTHIILLGLLPRGGDTKRHDMHDWPSIFARPFYAVNAHFRQYAALDGHIHYLDCEDRFFTPDRKLIDPALMPDALHPSAAGYELFADCLLPMVATIMHGHMPGGNGNATWAAAAQ